MSKSKKTPNHPVTPVIDLFAGPGGLGEGFSSFSSRGVHPFQVGLSIEKDPVACATLKLRKFLRQFEETPAELRNYFSGRAPLSEAYETYAEQAAAATAGVWNAELGKAPATSVSRAIEDRLKGASDWVLLGGPPCQAYSIAGRSRMRARPDFEDDERHFLYREYLRIVAEHEPAVFVLENVKGLLTSKHGGTKMVTRILDDLSAPGTAISNSGGSSRKYRLYPLGQRQTTLPWMDEDPQDGEQFLLKAEEFGIPQMRHRIFIVGVRSDIAGRPDALDRLPPVSIHQVLGDLPVIRSRLSRGEDTAASWRRAVRAIRDSDWMTSDSPELAKVIPLIRKTVSGLSALDLDGGTAFTSFRGRPAVLAEWYRKDASGLTLHEARSHMQSDLHRYLFTSAYGLAHGRSPEIQNFPKSLRPDHLNVERAMDGGSMFNDRFRVQLRDRPSTTVTSHISKDGHYYIHYDLPQCRSLTVREAARLQTFPDSYFFEGNRTQQYHQVGNAVPPLLARDIARVVHQLLADAASPSQ
jgi:DNA (cytosine-5)-methyltransferase 1